MSNRHERRHGQAPKVKRIPTYNMNEHQVEEISRKAQEDEFKKQKHQIVERVTVQLISTFILGLHETTGFGKIRLERVLQRVEFLMKGVEAGEFNIEDLLAECNKLGIDVQ